MSRLRERALDPYADPDTRLSIRLMNELWMLQANLGLVGVRVSVSNPVVEDGVASAVVYIEVPGKKGLVRVIVDGAREEGDGISVSTVMAVLVGKRSPGGQREPPRTLFKAEGLNFREFGELYRYLVDMYNGLADQMGIPRLRGRG